MKYRIVEISKPGYYHYFRVQRNWLFFFWDNEKACDTIEEARQFIKAQQVIETKKVVQ